MCCISNYASNSNGYKTVHKARIMLGLKKCLLLSALFGVSLTASLALHSTDANASQPPITTTLSLISENGEENFDVSDNAGNNAWYNIIKGNNVNTDNCSQQDIGQLSLLYANNDKKYLSVSQVKNYVPSNPNATSGQLYVSIVWDSQDHEIYNADTSDGNANLRPVGNFGSSKIGKLWINNSGQYTFECRPIYAGGFPSPIAIGDSTIAWLDSGTERAYIYYTTFTYTGEGTIPGQPPQEISVNHYQPELQVFRNEDLEKNILLSDKNFFTFDGIPFTCGEFVPQITIELYKETDGEQLIDARVGSASSQFSFNLANYINDTAQPTDFRAVSYYSCPEYTFDQVAFYDFKVDRDGNIGEPQPCQPELFCELPIPTYGLTQAVLAPLDFVSKLPNAQCTPVTLPMPLTLTDVNLPCMSPIYRDNFPVIFYTFQTIMTGLFAYYIGLRIFRSFKQITNPKDDSIETVDL